MTHFSGQLSVSVLITAIVADSGKIARNYVQLPWLLRLWRAYNILYVYMLVCSLYTCMPPTMQLNLLKSYIVLLLQTT